MVKNIQMRVICHHLLMRYFLTPQCGLLFWYSLESLTQIINLVGNQLSQSNVAIYRVLTTSIREMHIFKYPGNPENNDQTILVLDIKKQNKKSVPLPHVIQRDQLPLL